MCALTDYVVMAVHDKRGLENPATNTTGTVTQCRSNAVSGKREYFKYPTETIG
jgi:hypothetical protein